MTRVLVRTIALPALVLVPLFGCEAKKSSNPLSPSIAGPIAGVEITAPRLLEPGQGTRLKASQQPVRLLIDLDGEALSAAPAKDCCSMAFGSSSSFAQSTQRDQVAVFQNSLGCTLSCNSDHCPAQLLRCDH